ncbi:helix-turn-helix transcriptional regulator [Polynucleobacter asymbioticus]|jgi:predicted DNA-binding transcriptional regulator AlpA|uniref:helix-turn-helix transcriptional regulator n=1 Tax=Polynucleobacter asymbioticus TaxID=576611 RepID=UPI0008FB30C9|nr:AlpA family phage regulatory protein [Polynucleobacter asymbioticus]
MNEYVRVKRLAQKLSISVPTIWRKVAQGTFPKPIKLSAKITVWDLADIEQWVASKKNQ